MTRKLLEESRSLKRENERLKMENTRLKELLWDLIVKGYSKDDDRLLSPIIDFVEAVGGRHA